MAALSSIEINLDGLQKGLRLLIDCRLEHTLFDEKTTAAYHNEARYQLVEGCFYDYEFTDADFSFDEGNEKIVQSYKRKPNMGRLAPNIYVGTLSLPIIQKGKEHPVSALELEVRSIKSGYRDDYRDMLEGITEKCTDLLLQANSPVSHYFDIDHGKDSKTRYQKFSFIKSVLDSDEFAAAVHRIVSAPVTKWHEILEPKDVRQIKRLSNANCKELVKGSNRSRLPEQHYMRNYGITSLPERITTNRKTDSLDTPENRFVKHALETFLKFCSDIHRVAGLDSRLQKESFLLIKQLESQLHHSVFKDVSRPTTLKLNSPVLQRKEGYREVLRVWLMFDLAAKLIWTGGEDVYSGGKKDIATLYEYWLFFKLLDVLQSLFDIEPSDISDLIKPTADGLNLVLKQGEITAMNGTYSSGSRKLRVRFNYNRSFSGRKKYPKQGSWTTTLRPDYTLSLWPAGITDIEAEEQELIVHVHFDAKYKVANFMEYINEDADNLNAEKLENREGIYKNADLLKMHAYKDAIRRTGGAYVLYPGGIPVQRQGFHEIIPGLGAFPVRPSKTDSGVGALKNFIREIVEHFINRTSQREKVAYRTYKIHKDKPRPGQELKEPLPETYNENRDLLPDDTHVLVGFYKSQQQYEWITSRNLYNFRTGTKRGSLVLDKATVGASYLLLHTSGDTKSGDLWKIVSNGPKVFSKEDMLKKGYPDPKANYLLVEIEKVEDPAFANVKWDFRKLAGFGNGRGSGIPFASSLAALMRVKVMP